MVSYIFVDTSDSRGLLSFLKRAMNRLRRVRVDCTLHPCERAKVLPPTTDPQRAPFSHMCVVTVSLRLPRQPDLSRFTSKTATFMTIRAPQTRFCLSETTAHRQQGVRLSHGLSPISQYLQEALERFLAAG